MTQMYKYFEAIQEGNVELLEQLAIDAGYTERYDRIEEYERIINEIKECDSLNWHKNIDSSRVKKVFYEAFNFFVDGITEEEILERWENKKYHAEKRYSSTKSDSDAGISLLRWDMIPFYPIRGVDKHKIHFARTKEGPLPHNYSLVSCINWEDDSIWRMPRWRDTLFIDVFEKDPFKDKKFRRAMWTLELKCRSNPFNRIGIETENLIYGGQAIEYLLNPGNNFFPLSQEDYKNLLEEQKKKVQIQREEIEAAGGFDFLKRIDRESEEFFRSLSSKKFSLLYDIACRGKKRKIWGKKSKNLLERYKEFKKTDKVRDILRYFPKEEHHLTRLERILAKMENS